MMTVVSSTMCWAKKKPGSQPILDVKVEGEVTAGSSNGMGDIRDAKLIVTWRRMQVQ